ncbi:hypothetical protein [Maridesulfovibrio salexigens]|uniref:Lipoprotein n=1 Tax=Maridesulfovibrio salexigens (strain ATCC 14822 / DSM 2638 / NCIMB 8403 / VKM B-1763) TaxID=526222 RepID=C6BZN6_MARSD|nr:hypothetical protein [Maridesulfovibrio salexigens]ACS78943.1 hypothetical protein Desal_0877 [Maridesulfovibrio salexigens DSM 2638]
MKRLHSFIIALLLITALPACKKNTVSTIPEFSTSYIEVSNKKEAFDKGYFQVVGRGNGESKSMALLAARSVAQARLVEIVEGIEVERNTLVKEGKVQGDIIQTKAKGVVKFSSLCGEQYNPATGNAEVCLRLPLKTGGLGDLVEDLIVK